MQIDMYRFLQENETARKLDAGIVQRTYQTMLDNGRDILAVRLFIFQ